MIRRAVKSDLQSLVDIHVAALPDDLLPRLGKKFLFGIFYPTVLDSKQAFTIVNEDDGIVNAFVIFAYRSKNLTHEVTKNKAALGFHFLSGLLSDRIILNEAIAFSRGFQVQLEIELDEKLENLPELYLIATDPRMQSKGIGAQIVGKGLEILASKGFYKSYVKTSSERARDFYLKQGYKWIGYEYRQKRKLHLLLNIYHQNNKSSHAGD